MKTLIAILALCSISCASFAQDKEETAVTAAVETFRKAMIDADTATLNSITGKRLSYGHSSGKLEDKAAFIASIGSGQSDFVTMTLANQVIYVTGTTAIVRHDLTGDTNDGGKPGTVSLHVMQVWSGKGGKWKLVGRQAVKKQ